MFGKLFNTLVDTALLPVEAVKDVFTLGGVVTDEGDPYTVQRLNKMVKDWDDAE